MEDLPAKHNGYRVVAECINCHYFLTLWKNHRGEPQLVHTVDLERACPLYHLAEPDRPVMELGLFQ